MGSEMCIRDSLPAENFTADHSIRQTSAVNHVHVGGNAFQLIQMAVFPFDWALLFFSILSVLSAHSTEVLASLPVRGDSRLGTGSTLLV